MRAAPLILACLALAPVLGCGGGSAEDTTGASTATLEREADIEALNRILGRQRAAVDAYDRTIAAMRGRPRALALRLRTQEQEHTVAILAALRGFEGSEEIVEEAIESDPLHGEAERLTFLYEVEAATIEDELAVLAKLNSPSARSLLAQTVANQAQHLVLLRRALGAKPDQWAPAPFENGATPAPTAKPSN